MSKKVLICFVLAVLSISSGCASQSASENRSDAASQKSDAVEDETNFPSSYNAESDSGKVKFNCTLEVPEIANNRLISKTTAEGVHSCDKDKAYSMFVDGNEVSQKEEYDGDSDPDVYYTFVDGSNLYLGDNLSWGSSTSSIYSLLGVQRSEYIEMLSSGSVSLDKNSCIEAVKHELDGLGYQTEDLDFQAYPITVEGMKELKEQELESGLLEEGDTSEPVSEDEAYFIYAYQENAGIPVFHELMSMAKQMSDDSADNAPVQAIYSARGLEQLNVDYLYDFKNEENTVELQPFDEIAKVVEEKYENMLNDSSYEITRAKLYERVYAGEDQKYAEEPIWYFEVIENGTNKTVMLVNAETGKEINLPS